MIAKAERRGQVRHNQHTRKHVPTTALPERHSRGGSEGGLVHNLLGMRV
jgi:hypothetical protein